MRDKTGEGSDELKSFIDRNTQLHSIYWLFTVKDTSYPDVAMLADVWKRYSAFSDARQREGGRFHQDAEIDDVREIDGWIVLDDENRDDEIGIEIIRAEVLSKKSDEEDIDEDQALVNMDLLTEGAIRNLSNPFIAWVLIELCRMGKLDINKMVTLSYVNLITQFWQQRGTIFLDYFWNKFDPESKIRAGSVSDSDSIIRPVAQVLANQGEFSFRWNDLAKAVKKAAASDVDFEAERFATAALSAFVETNLLASYSAPDPLHPGDSASMLEIRFEPFWEYHLARRLLNTDSIKSFDKDGARLDLDTWFGVVTDGEIKAGVLEFLFLLLDEALPVAEQPDRAGRAHNFLKSLVGFGLKSEALPNRSVWFAGAKATEEFQRMVVGVTTGELEDGLIRRELHAFMYFINAVLPEVLSPTERLKLLQPFYRQISESGLSGYFRYIAMRLIRRIGDAETLLWCMVYLDGCEVMGYASELAEATMMKLFDIARSTGKDSAPDEPEDTDLILDSITDVIIKYLQTRTDLGQSWREMPKKERQPPPYHYLALSLERVL